MIQRWLRDYQTQRYQGFRPLHLSDIAWNAQSFISNHLPRCLSLMTTTRNAFHCLSKKSYEKCLITFNVMYLCQGFRNIALWTKHIFDQYPEGHRSDRRRAAKRSSVVNPTLISFLKAKNHHFFSLWWASWNGESWPERGSWTFATVITEKTCKIQRWLIWTHSIKAFQLC